MSSDAGSKLPPKKTSILWVLCVLFFLLLAVFFFQLFGPNPRLLVSKQTTYLTEPLGPNGLPDYERHVLEQYRDGVTPQNNAATLLWKALWPGELQPNEYASVAKELGLPRVPLASESLNNVYGKENQAAVWKWLARIWPNQKDLSDVDGFIEPIIDQAMSRPWTSEQIPPLALWVQENKKPLDLLLEASRRPRCYFPSQSLMNDQNEMLIHMLLSGVQGSREVSRSLPARAMWHLGGGRPDEAWQDLLATHRIARLVAQGNTLVEQLVAIAIDGIACDRTQTLVHHGNLNSEQLQQIRRDLATLPPFAGMAPAIDQSERLYAVDAVVQLAGTSEMTWQRMAEELEIDMGGGQVLQVVSVDWNLVLRDINRWYDRLAAAAKLPDRAKRDAAFDQFEADLQTFIAESQTPVRLALSVVSRGQRSQVVAALMLSTFFPALSAVTRAEDRANAIMQLTELAAALAEYRATHSAYPDQLDQLVPEALDKLPADIHNNLPFFYKRDGEGYLLYSAGENGTDDGGSNERDGIDGGQLIFEFDDEEAAKRKAKIPPNADDISVRLPRPPLKLPPFPPPAEEP